MQAPTIGNRMLFESERHEPLLEIAWNEARARQAIQSIVRAWSSLALPAPAFRLVPAQWQVCNDLSDAGVDEAQRANAS